VMNTSLSNAVRDLDFLGPELTQDPYRYVAELREKDPVHWSEIHQAWLLTKYDDVVAAFADPRMSSDRVKPLLQAMGEERRQKAGKVLELIQDWMVVTDPPAHTRLRKLVAQAFSPKRIAASEARILKLVDELIDDFVAQGHTEFIANFSYPLPATVIAQLIGAPAEDQDRFRTWSQALAMVAFGGGGEERGERHTVATQALGEMIAYFGERIDHATAHPGEDMISGLLEGDGQGNVLTRDEIEAMCALMLFAGHETTMNLLNHMVLHVTRHPDQLQIIREDPAEVGGAVEEILRYDGPIKILQRWVTDDVELRGKTIKAGDRVFIVLAGANRDGGRFPHPDTLDITRSPNRHVGFGRGVHTCIGAQLSRIEGRVAFGRLLERLPGLSVPEQPLQYIPTLAGRALQELHVEHDA
jgi:cytochrome P450